MKIEFTKVVFGIYLKIFMREGEGMNSENLSYPLVQQRNIWQSQALEAAAIIT